MNLMSHGRLAGALFLAMALGLFTMGGIQAADKAEDAAVKDLMRQPLDAAARYHDHPAAISLTEVTLPPGGDSEPHRHPGPVAVYVLEGTLIFQAGDGPLQTVYAGGTVFEPAGVIHRVARNPSQTDPVRFLAWMLIDANETELVLPVD